MKKTILSSYMTTALLLAPAALSLGVAPSSAWAQQFMPEVRALEAAADGPLEPGTLLTFTLSATSRGEATMRLRGVPEVISLSEVSRGEYVGRYTIKRGDRLDGGTEVRATLRSGDRTAVADYQLAQVLPRQRPPVAVPRLPEPRIERFGISPLERIEPGVEIRFGLEGTPGGTAVVDLPGVSNDVVLREVRPGFYEGGYTVRRADNFNPQRPIVATLRIGDRVSTTNIPLPIQRPAADNRPPVVTDASPRDGATVPAGTLVQIGARFDDAGGSGVDPASVQIIVSGRNVTRESQITPQSFVFRDGLPPGRHTVDVTARDRAGNAVRTGWSFNVVAAAPVPVRPIVVAPVIVAPVAVAADNEPITIHNHRDEGRLEPGSVVIRAHTGTNAVVTVDVQAIGPGNVPIGRPLLSQTMSSDDNGDFAFGFVQPVAGPGVRYEIAMTSTRGKMRVEKRLVLYPR